MNYRWRIAQMGDIPAIQEMMEWTANGKDPKRIRAYIGSGCVIVNPIAAIIFLRGDKTMRVELFSVHPAHRRSGHGRLLVNSLLRRAWNHGYLRVTLRAYTGNVGAKTFWKKCGFTIARRTFHYNLMEARCPAKNT